MSQETLARRVGVRQATVSAVESGDVQNPHHLARYAKALDVSVDYLATGHDHPPDGVLMESVDSLEDDSPVMKVERVLLRDMVEGANHRTLEAFRASKADAIESIQAGDVLLVDVNSTDPAQVIEGLYVVQVGEGVVVRHLQRRLDGAVVISGASGPAEVVPAIQVLKIPIVGKVVLRLGAV